MHLPDAAKPARVGVLAHRRVLAGKWWAMTPTLLALVPPPKSEAGICTNSIEMDPGPHEQSVFICVDLWLALRFGYNGIMTTSLTATFDGKVLIPAGPVDLPQGAVLRLHVELPQQPTAPAGPLSAIPAFGLWADRTDLGDTIEFSRHLRRAVETREDRAK